MIHERTHDDADRNVYAGGTFGGAACNAIAAMDSQACEVDDGGSG